MTKKSAFRWLIVMYSLLMVHAWRIVSSRAPVFTKLPLWARRKQQNPSSSPTPFPFKTGRHTYANWQGKENRDYDQADEDFDENFEEVGEEEEDDEMTRDSQIDDESNPLLDWMRKLYDGIFFYGLETPIPKSYRTKEGRAQWREKMRSRREVVEQQRQNDMAGEELEEQEEEEQQNASARRRKSVFFTSSELKGRELLDQAAGLKIDDDERQDEIAEGEGKSFVPSSSKRRRGEGGSLQASSTKTSPKRQRALNGSGGRLDDGDMDMTPDEQLVQIDNVLSDLSEELRVLDVSISAAMIGNKREGGTSKEVERLDKIRERLLEQIEDAQVKYVSLRAQLDESG